MEVSRTYTHDALLCDGTPRRERGYRAIARIEHDKPVRRVEYVTSPLFKTRADADEWVSV